MLRWQIKISCFDLNNVLVLQFHFEDHMNIKCVNFRASQYSVLHMAFDLTKLSAEICKYGNSAEISLMENEAKADR